MKKINLNSSLFVGLDIHSRTHTALAVDRFEQELGSFTFANNQTGITKFVSWLEQLRKKNQNSKPVIVGIEGSGGYGRQLTLSLAGKFDHLYEVNPLYVKQRREYGTRRDQSDERDAKLVAEVLIKKLSELPRITLAEESDKLFALKELVMEYDELVRQRTRLKNQLYRIARKQGVLKERIYFSQKRVKAWQAKFSRIRNKEDVSSEKKATALVACHKLALLKRLNPLIKKTKRQIERLFEQSRYKNLGTMKGISTILGAKIVCEVKGIERFANVNKFIRYAGLSPKEASSGTRKRHKKQKTGNRRLNAALYFLALNQMRWSDQSREYFEKKVAEGKTKRHAIKCLAKRVACILYGMMRSGKSYHN